MTWNYRFGPSENVLYTVHACRAKETMKREGESWITLIIISSTTVKASPKILPHLSYVACILILIAGAALHPLLQGWSFLGQRFCVLWFEICTPSLSSPSTLRNANFNTKQAQNLWHHKYILPCKCLWNFHFEFSCRLLRDDYLAHKEKKRQRRQTWQIGSNGKRP